MTLFIVTVVSFLTILPRTIWHIIPPHMSSKVCPEIFYRIDCSFFALYFFNYIVNPVIYAVRMRKFRKAARKLVSTKTLELNASPAHITSYITCTYSRNTCWRKNIGNERSPRRKALTSLLRSCCHWISFVILINVIKIWMTKPRGREGKQGMRCGFSCLCRPWSGAFLLSQGRGYFKLASVDVHWDQQDIAVSK